MKKRSFPTIFVIPTGIGCSIGGFAGDAMPTARLLAEASGCLITHPNVMNGGSLYWPDKKIKYVEGYSLDQFAAGKLCLKDVRQQRVGLLLDKGINDNLKQRHIQVAEGCKASLGLDIGPYIITEQPLSVQLKKGASGSSWGGVQEVDILIRAAEKLKEAGATAIAVVTDFPEGKDISETDLYREGTGVDLIAGAEAVISHLLVKHLAIPCAHAPALEPLGVNLNLDPRAAGEEIGYTFLASVLVGLSRAPDLILLSDLPITQKGLLITKNHLTIQDVEAIVVPEGALGGEAVLACIERHIPVITVCNPNVENVTSEKLGLKDLFRYKEKSCFSVRNYVEAAGLILALREGINVCALERPIEKLKQEW